MAKYDYKEVMNRLRHPHQNQDLTPPPTTQSSKRRPALLSMDDLVDPDDWLENDLAPSTKKQKFLTDTDYAPNVKTKTRNTTSLSPVKSSRSTATPVHYSRLFDSPPRSSNTPSRVHHVIDSPSPSPKQRRMAPLSLEKSPIQASPLFSSSPLVDSTNRELSFVDINIDDEIQIWQTGIDHGGVGWETATNTEEERRKERKKREIEVLRKKQSRLTDAGFQRRRSHSSSEQTDSIPDSTTQLTPVNVPDDSLPFANDSGSGLNSTRRSAIKSLAVRIDTELISVPVKSDEIDKLTVGWLVKEAASRYAK